ncbi:DUF488 domain-containing protein [Bordetella pseudohinzii]|uniref:Uncharacterized conserved protein n=1 Tax=Bordetella pseudohinzii TaxID=1331258 RepID=A0A0J6C7F8_9BORD|nr:DUF488 family protein [Bordetella pseudohinzii]ANY16252.1 hypothetical protein BBN53_10310 [Bordetella pseudohinzii]KMM25247.1 uroporphyrin-III C-methyltransferase [Bordetella pseudohinzii]KXA76117.1 hypothetical protein AW877_17705 [Bordetella pseudohinzii]KXA77982.1 hypothetical protein AW878_13925 [Bordetella pseudohinzii]CUJ14905.1 Uncharacterized conserved protein [Bordetella pseudohinzii]
MRKPKDIVMKRAYEAAAPEDGYRVLVDRLWPRGRSKDTLKLDEWAKSLAPSEAARKAYCHDPALWGDFRKAYRHELAQAEQQAGMQALLQAAAGRRLTLVYASRDGEHSNAEVLFEVLRDQLKRA